ncbi:hypothetical protein Hanom_Chr07g00634041 [Helianthus anomalus]
MARFQTFWIQMRKNKPLDESCKTGQNLKDENAILLVKRIIILDRSIYCYLLGSFLL